MKEKSLKILQHYGINTEIKKLGEECWELHEAVISQLEYQNIIGKTSKVHIEHIEEEVADILVVLMHIINFFELEKENLKKIQSYKLDRTLKRLEKEL